MGVFLEDPSPDPHENFTTTVTLNRADIDRLKDMGQVRYREERLSPLLRIVVADFIARQDDAPTSATDEAAA